MLRQRSLPLLILAVVVVVALVAVGAALNPNEEAQRRQQQQLQMRKVREALRRQAGGAPEMQRSRAKSGAKHGEQQQHVASVSEQRKETEKIRKQRHWKRRGKDGKFLYRRPKDRLRAKMARLAAKAAREQQANAQQEQKRAEDGGDAEEDGRCRVTPFDRNVAVWFYVGGMLYIFYGLALICEGKFKDSIIEIANQMQLSDDVAGATFMAAGTSSPELFISMVALFLPGNDDVGASTIVGSAIFNIAVIIGLSGALRGMRRPFRIDWRFVMRDSMVNALTFIFLVLIFLDGRITWFESVVTLSLYAGYIYMLSRNDEVMTWISNRLPSIVARLSGGKLRLEPPVPLSKGFVDLGSPSHKEYNFESRGASPDKPQSPRSREERSHSNSAAKLEEGRQNGGRPDEQTNHNGAAAAPATGHRQGKLKSSGDGAAHEEEAQHERRELPVVESWRGYLTWLIIVLQSPYQLIFRTIPSCKGESPKRAFITFAVSLMWIAMMTWMMVKASVRVGCVWEIDDAVLGVTLLAVGTSTPDLLTSIYVARGGNGNMAVSNALGSNIFDVLIALGVPWFLWTSLGLPVEVDGSDIVFYTIILFATLITFISSLWLNNWMLDTKVGLGLALIYVVFCLVDLRSEGVI